MWKEQGLKYKFGRALISRSVYEALENVKDALEYEGTKVKSQSTRAGL